VDIPSCSSGVIQSNGLHGVGGIGDGSISGSFRCQNEDQELEISTKFSSFGAVFNSFL
jgi:hypothetical protein